MRSLLILLMLTVLGGCRCRPPIATLESTFDAPMRVDFGRATVGQTVVRTLPIRNTGKVSVDIDDFTVTPAGSPFFADITSVPVPAGATVGVQLRWVARGPALGEETATLSISAMGFADLLPVELVGEVVAVDSGSADSGADAGPADAGAPDAGRFDAGVLDAGGVDAGGVDAGGFDAGGVDAGGVDAGGIDAGTVDAGPCVTVRTEFVTPLALYGGSATGLAFDSADNLYVAENYVGGVPGVSRISKVTPAGQRTTFVPPGTIASASALAVDTADNLYVGDGNGMGLSGSMPLNKVWKVDPAGNVTTFIASVADPTGLAFDSSGRLYVASFDDNAVYRYSSTGALIDMFAGPFFRAPYGIAFDVTGNLYVAAFGPVLMHDTKVYKVTPAGQISTFADPGIIDPADVAFDPNGDLWVTYYDDFKLVRVTPAGMLTIYPGGWSSDDASNGIAFDSHGNLYFATTGGRSTAAPAVVKVSGVDCPSN